MATSSSLPAVSIILLTKNSQHYLREILQAIYSQATSHGFEVIAVDSGSQDSTLDILAEYPVRLFQIPPEEFNHGETRNLGARQAHPSSQYLVYLTHDATPATPYWLENLLVAVNESPQVAGAFSRHLPRPTCPLPMARLLAEEWEQSGMPTRVVKRFTDPDDYERRRAYYAWFSNSSSCLRKDVWQQFSFARVEFAEDAEWADRVLRAGYTLIYEPSSTIIHSHDYSLWEQFAQNMDHARGMKRIFSSSVYNSVPHLLNQVAELFRLFRRDARFIAHQPIRLWHKLYWLIYSPAWHLASHLGALVGQNYGRLPQGLLRQISRQGRLQRQGNHRSALR